MSNCGVGLSEIKVGTHGDRMCLAKQDGNGGSRETFQGCACVRCIFLRGSAQLGTVFCIHVALLQRQLHISKSEVRVMLKGFCTISSTLKQTCALKPSGIQNWKYKVVIAVRNYSRIIRTAKN